MLDHTAHCLPDVFSAAEVDRLLQMLDRCEWAKIRDDEIDTANDVQYRSKHIHYNHQLSPFRRIIYPKIRDIIGDHVCSHAVYNEVLRPSYVHLDTTVALNAIDAPQTNHTRNLAMLICLSEHSSYSTAFFDFSPSSGEFKLGDPLPDSGTDNEQDIMELLDHHPTEAYQQLKRVPTSAILQWKIGSVLVWDRRQLHCSTNFRKHTDLGKKFILLLI